MIARRPIVCFSVSQWNDVPHNSRHLMRVAHARGSRVLYVESVGQRPPNLTKRDAVRIARRLRRMVHPLRQVRPGYWVFAPVAVPWHGARWVDQANRRMLGLQLRLVCAALRFKRPIFLSYLPQYVGLADDVNAAAAVYFRTDDYAAIPGVAGPSIERAESAAVARADLCIAPARRYFDDVLANAKRKLWLPNGVDTDAYGRVTRDRVSRDSYEGVPRPVVLMVGTIESWVNVELLEALADARPGWTVAIAGPEKVNAARLFARPNVLYLGVVAYADLPRYVGDADVGVIPFRKGRISAGATPGKLYQYLAAGIPVVATDSIDAHIFGSLVQTCREDPLDFVASIETVLRDDTDELRAQRQAFAANNSWDARFAEVEAALPELSPGPVAPMETGLRSADAADSVESAS